MCVCSQDSEPPQSPPSLPSLLTLTDDEFGELQERGRVHSISGKPVRPRGMELVIGEESSSESEDEGDESHSNSSAGESLSGWQC